MINIDIKKSNYFKHLIASILFIMLAVSNGFSQSKLAPQWFTSSVGEQWDIITHMIIDEQGNIYLAGNFSGTTTAAVGGKTINGDRDIFIARYDSSGVNTWLYNISSTGYCYISSISSVNNGFYLCGYFSNTLEIDGNSLFAPTVSSMFITSMDDIGNVDWLKQIDGDFKGNPTFLQTGIKDELLLATTFGGELMFDDVTRESKEGTSIMLTRFSDTGIIKDTLFLEGSGNCVVKDFILIDSNIYLTGSFDKELYFDNDTLISKGQDDAFFIKLDEQFQYIYTNQIGSNYNDFGSTVKIDTNGCVIFAGAHTGEIKLQNDTILKPIGSYDVFICKYDKNGQLIWGDNFGGQAGDIVSDISINSYNDIYLTGNYRGEIEKGNSKIISKNFSNDIFIAKYTTNGTFRYIESVGDTNTDLACGIKIDMENYILISGNFVNSFSLLDIDADTAINSEYFLAKLYDCDFSPKIVLPADTNLCAEQLVIISDSSFAKYKWNGVDGKNIYKVDTTGMYILEVIDKHKCITIDTIMVEINSLPEVDLGEDLVAEQGEEITLFAGYDFEQYLWNTNDTNSYLDIYTVNMQSGEYTYEVMVKDTNQCKSIDSLKLLVNDMDEESLQINAFPNPTKDFVILHIANIEPNTKLQVQFISVKGDIIWSKDYKTTCSRFYQRYNLRQLSNGTYNLSIQHSDGVNVIKIIKM